MREASPRSSARTAGYPIHPVLVPFPVTLLAAALARHPVSRGTGPAIPAAAALWLPGAGLVAAAPTAAIAFTDVLGDGRIRALREAPQHVGGDLVAAIAPSTGRKGGELVYRHRVGIADAAEPRR